VTTFQNLNRCVACGGFNLSLVIDLEDQPLANDFSRCPRYTSIEKYPLALNRCDSCGHLQLTVSVDRSSIFNNYIYRSGTSNTLKQYSDWFAKKITDRHGVGRILDIACNDGTQLDSFKKLGWETYGVDPAQNISEYNKHEHRVAFFDEKCLDLGRFDVIIAQNVLAHTDDPQKILEVAGMMSDNIYIQTSQAKMIDRGEFDTIYHEHISFFSPSSMAALANASGLGLKHFEIVPIHGDSFLFYISSGFQNTETYTWSKEETDIFAEKAKRIVLDLGKVMVETDLPIIGYGAAAKAMTVINAMGIGPDYIVDDAVDKQFKFCPGSNIPVLPVDVLTDAPDHIMFIPFAWNFAEEIINRTRLVYKGKMDIVKYFPEVSMWQQS
jgi:hypothetical protein